VSGEPAAVRAARRRRASGIVTDFDGGRLALARRLACRSRVGLAQDLDLTPSAITQFEKGQARPTSAVLAQLSLVLGLPGDFFRLGRPVSTLSPSSAHFRSLRSTPALVRDQALAFGELGLEVAALIEQYVDLPLPELPDLRRDTELTPAHVVHAARLTREHLQVPQGPIPHVVRLLETYGVLVLRLPGDKVDPHVDAFSTNAGYRPLILLSPLKDDRARSRFDAAHELGHLILHHDVEPGSKIVENQAHTFAAEFLMPADEVADDLPRKVDWDQLHTAKRRWGTSLKALVYRAHTLKLMSDTAYRNANQQLSTWGNPEPGPLGPPEAPSLLGAAADLLGRHGTTVSDLAALSRLPESQIREIVAAATDPRPRVRPSVR
jgi:Zn-dependent peptidase ImmA (M78 family)